MTRLCDMNYPSYVFINIFRSTVFRLFLLSSLAGWLDSAEKSIGCLSIGRDTGNRNHSFTLKRKFLSQLQNAVIHFKDLLGQATSMKTTVCLIEREMILGRRLVRVERREARNIKYKTTKPLGLFAQPCQVPSPSSHRVTLGLGIEQFLPN